MNSVVLSRSLVFSLMLSSSCYASEIQIDGFQSIENNNNRPVEVYEPDNLTDSQRVQLDRSQDALEFVDFIALIHADANKEAVASSPLLNARTKLEGVTTQLELLRGGDVLPLIDASLPGKMERGFSAKAFYANATPLKIGKLKFSKLSLSDLCGQVNNFKKNLFLVAGFLDKDAQKEAVEALYKPLLRQWFSLLKAYEDKDEMRLYEKTFTAFMLNQERFNNLIKPFIDHVRTYQERLGQCDDILGDLRKSCTELDAVDEGVVQDLISMGKQLDRLKSFMSQQEGAQKEFRDIFLAHLRNESASLKFTKQIKRHPLSDIQKEVARLLKTIDGESLDEEGLMGAVFSGASGESPTSGRKYAQALAPKKIKRGPAVVSAVEVAKSPTVVAPVIPELDWNNSDIDWAKNGPTEDAVIVHGRHNFDKWISHLEPGIRRSLLQGLVGLAHGDTTLDTNSLTNRGNYLGVPLTLHEFRFRQKEVTLRVYFCNEGGKLHIIHWGDKNDQDNDIIAAVKVRKEIISDAIKAKRG